MIAATTWSERRLDELTDPLRPITYGVVKPGDHDDANGVLFVRGGDIAEGKINVENLRTISSKVSAGYKRTLLRGGEVLVSLVGNPGESAVVPKSLVGANIARQAGLVALKEDVDPFFIMYFLRSPRGKSELFAQTTGSVQKVINLANLKNIRVPLPDLPTQRRIVGILSAYDDLIENNLRRIRILEEMAQSLYREWFVHFRYPGYESAAPMSDNSLPAGWRFAALGGITSKIGSGATPRGGKDAYKTEGTPLIRSMNIYDYEFDFADLAYIDDQQAAQLDNVAVEPRDVLLNITGASVCRCSMVPSALVPARVNQHVVILRADGMSLLPHFLLDSINSTYNKQRLLSISRGGATREALTKEMICQFEIVLPPTSLLKKYDEMAGTIHFQRELLAQKNQTLRQTRDLLLPKLLSGHAA